MRRETSLEINGISKNPYLFNSTKVTILIPYSKLKIIRKKIFLKMIYVWECGILKL